ncbi:DoxX family protein [Chelatococcus reniformis]|uniref:LysR family transcriptional regulator n=1 Tax=Chelatococcus reniformis TaxID=1494448 RepID=A0A916U7R6_9HYPH|nr:DoxX family protein [Chelatococcus reniformis]GGC62326.1 LysR family transcriptional regulator [Chelatococcus reniformis]
MTDATRYLPALGRLLIAIIFIMSGIRKLLGPDGTEAYIAAAGMPLPTLAYWIAVVVELGGGLLLLVGYQTRWAALVLAVFSAAAAIGFHAKFGDQNQMIHFLKNLAIAGGLLQIVHFGGGAFSADAARR